jgi:hypothetical protein
VENLYKVYGELMIQAEILQSKIMEVKKQIAEGLSKPKEAEQKE